MGTARNAAPGHLIRHHRGMTTFHDALRALDERFIRIREEGKVPGVAWGVVRDGALVHAGGSGTIRDGETLTPDADSVYRIASMTKSFTASAIMLLRDEGRLRLDDPAADYVPQLARWSGPTADAAPVTIRRLLTMSAGLPTDDPWGDRQQGLPLDAFADLLEAGPTFAWPPGTVFEYSNLGYAILGRVVTAAAGQEYRAFVSDRLLVPLGMTSTAYREEDLLPARLANGYMRRGDTLVHEGTDPYGAFASMGGVYSTVRDLATWVAGFLDAFPARDDPEGNHPLRRASRREMQQMHRILPALIGAHPAHEPPMPETAGYGFGLFLVSNAAIGTRVSHGGGYPGFGTHMAWHPASGLGVIALGNVRYAPVHDAVVEELTALVRAGSVPRRRLRLLPSVEAFRPVVERLLAAWDDDAADAAFAMNMDLDDPREVRREAVGKLAAELGPFHVDEARPATSESPAHLAWWLRGERGWVRASILVNPEPVPRLQAMRLSAVPDPSAELVGLAERLLEAARDGHDGAPAWPADLVAGPDVDVTVVTRALLAAAARFGPMRLGFPTAGDGHATATLEIHGELAKGVDAGPSAPATLTVARDPDTGALTAAALRIADREAPVEAW
jgi:CubicO group peptidase (beta-lactamase class C family)